MAPKFINFLMMVYVLTPTLFSGYMSYVMTATKNNLSVDTLSAWNEPSCPFNCTCSPNLKGLTLEVDCTHRTDDNSSLLAEEIDHLLDLITPDLTYFAISHTNLTVVPYSVCHLEKLSQLKLEYNRIAMLPENCFTKMVNLETFSAVYNNLSEIQV